MDRQGGFRRVLLALGLGLALAANAGPCLGNGSRAVTSVAARPFGRTTIIGTAFLSAYRLSSTATAPPFGHSFSSPPMPCSR